MVSNEIIYIRNSKTDESLKLYIKYYSKDHLILSPSKSELLEPITIYYKDIPQYAKKMFGFFVGNEENNKNKMGRPKGMTEEKIVKCKEVSRLYKEKGVPIKVGCEQVGVNRRTFYTWNNYYKGFQ